MSKVETAITLTDSAVAKIRTLLAEEQQPQSLRVTVKAGGCSGFKYSFDFDTETQSDDISWQQDGVGVVIDEFSAEHLRGSSVDFQAGLLGKGFVIEKPNATGSCGCGESFS